MVPRKRPVIQELKVTASGESASDESKKETTPRREKVQKQKAYASGRKSGGSRFLKFSIVILIICGIGFATLTYFASAEITLTRKTETETLQTDLVAMANTGGDISYKSMTLERDATTTVPASTEQDVESKATGIVVIYNNYSDKPYRLIKNTRLESSNNRIFKISDTVVIPGKTTRGGAVTPGSAAASVFADSDGPEYNVGFSDFTIPGFKGMPQYSGFYARSKTAIAGGWSGKKNVASDADLAKAVQSLESSMSAELQKEAQAEIPDSYILLSGASATAFDTPVMQNSGSDVSVAIHAKFYGMLFANADISKLISLKASYKLKQPYAISGTETLVAIPKGDFAAALAASQPVPFSLKGSPVAKSVIDPAVLQKALVDKPRTSLESILAGFPGISSADVKILPFWKESFPSDPQKIKIIVQ